MTWSAGERAERLLGRVTYRPGMRLEVHQDVMHGALTLVTTRMVENTYQPGQMIRVNTMDPIPGFLVAHDGMEDHFYRWLRETIHRIEMHEADEFLRIDGVMRWNPHANDPEVARR